MCLDWLNTQLNKFTKAICSGVLYFTFSKSGEATSSASERARERATLSRSLVVEKIHRPWQGITVGGGEGHHDHLGFLSLKLVHGADPGAFRQDALQPIDPPIVRRNDQDVLDADPARALVPVLVALLPQAGVQRGHGGGDEAAEVGCRRQVISRKIPRSGGLVAAPSSR